MTLKRVLLDRTADREADLRRGARAPRTLGPVHVEPVSVGIFFKQPRKFAQLRPMQKWVALSFSLPRKVDHRLIDAEADRRTAAATTTSSICAAPTTSTTTIRSWLTEAYFDSPC